MVGDTVVEGVLARRCNWLILLKRLCVGLSWPPCSSGSSWCWLGICFRLAAAPDGELASGLPSTRRRYPSGRRNAFLLVNGWVSRQILPVLWWLPVLPQTLALGVSSTAVIAFAGG